MSKIIDSLKVLRLQQRPVLFEPHPLLSEPAAVKLRYLAFVALPITISRSNDVLEKAAFLALAQGLDISKDDALEIWQERDSLLTEDITKGVAQLIATETRWACLCDSIWIQRQQQLSLDIATEDQQATELLAQLLGIHDEFLAQLYEVLATIATQKQAKAMRTANRLPRNPSLTPLLTQAIAQIPHKPYQLSRADWQAYRQLYCKKVGNRSDANLNYFALTFSTDGTELLSFLLDNNNTPHLMRMNSEDGAQLKTIALQHQSNLDSYCNYLWCQFSADKKWIVYHHYHSRQEKYYTYVHNAETGIRLYQFEAKSVNEGAFNPNSSYLGLNNAILNLNSLKRQPLADANGYIVLSNELAIARHTKAGIGLWDIHTGDYIKHLTESDLYPITLSPDNIWLLVGKLQQINLSTGEMRWQHYIEGDLTDACYSPNGAWVAAILDKANIVIYDAATGERVALFAHNVESVDSLNFSPDSEQLLVSGSTRDNRSFCLFSCATVVAAV